MPHRQHPKRFSGFSLVEIAIVIAIIGLLVGGVLMGQNLLKGQQLRKVLTDATAYATSINQFKLKYGALPGDMPNATEVWGRMNGNADCVSNTGVAVNTVGACDGNGDGSLGYASAINASSEQFQIWRQLNLAGMLQGTFTGLNGPGSTFYDVMPGVNSPKASIEKTTFWFYDWGVRNPSDTPTVWYDGDYTNNMVFGARVLNAWNFGPAITGVQAFELDTKADDGRPALGSVRTLANTWMWANTGECTSSDTPSTANYVLRPTVGVTHGCILLFLNTLMSNKS